MAVSLLKSKRPLRLLLLLLLLASGKRFPGKFIPVCLCGLWWWTLSLRYEKRKKGQSGEFVFFSFSYFYKSFSFSSILCPPSVVQCRWYSSFVIFSSLFRPSLCIYKAFRSYQWYLLLTCGNYEFLSTSLPLLLLLLLEYVPNFKLFVFCLNSFLGGPISNKSFNNKEMSFNIPTADRRPTVWHKYYMIIGIWLNPILLYATRATKMPFLSFHFLVPRRLSLSQLFKLYINSQLESRKRQREREILILWEIGRMLAARKKD